MRLPSARASTQRHVNTSPRHAAGEGASTAPQTADKFRPSGGLASNPTWAVGAMMARRGWVGMVATGCLAARQAPRHQVECGRTSATVYAPGCRHFNASPRADRGHGPVSCGGSGAPPFSIKRDPGSQVEGAGRAHPHRCSNVGPGPEGTFGSRCVRPRPAIGGDFNPAERPGAPSRAGTRWREAPTDSSGSPTLGGGRKPFPNDLVVLLRP